MYKLLLISFVFVGSLNAQSRFVEGGFMHCDSVVSDENNSAIDLSDLDITKIELVSFDYFFLRYKKNVFSAKGTNLVKLKGHGSKSRNIYKPINKFDIKNLSIDYDHVKELATIKNKVEISTILKVINGNFASSFEKGGSALCYKPRNSIVFKNANNEIEYIIELCFECSNYVIVAQGIDPLDRRLGICNITVEYIKRLFGSKGISYGIDRIN